MKTIHRELEQLDVLRGIAIILVFAYHWHIAIDRMYIPVNSDKLTLNIAGSSFDQIWSNFSPAHYGFVGIQLFLVLSGFLIHYKFLNTRKATGGFKQFYWNRFWRIYPPYLFVLLVITLYTSESRLYYWHSSEGLLNLVSHILMVHNLIPNDAYLFGINPSFWSIALAVQLYLLYPLFLLMREKWGIKKVCLGLLGLHLLAIGVIYGITKGNPTSLAYNTFVLHYWGIWAIGAWAGESYIKKRRLSNLNWFTIIALAAVFYVSQYFIMFFQYASHIMAAILWALLIDKFLSEQRTFKGLEALIIKGLLFVGICSYSFYLIHLPLMPLLKNLLTFIGYGWEDSFSAFVVVGITIVGISNIMYQHLEVPSIELGRILSRKNGREKVMFKSDRKKVPNYEQ